MSSNLYKLLGVSSSASKKDIQKAFRKLALDFHPDRHPDMSPMSRATLEEQFKAITHAYDILVSDESRKLYDMSNSSSPYTSYDSRYNSAYNDFDFSSSSYYNSKSTDNSSRYYKSSTSTSSGPIPEHLFNQKEWEEAHYGIYESIYYTGSNPFNSGVTFMSSWMNHQSKNNKYFYKKHMEDLKREKGQW